MFSATSEKLLPVIRSISRLNKQRHLYSIRNSFLSIMPLMIIGAFAVAFNQLPIPRYQEFMASVFGERWTVFGGTIYNATMMLASLLIAYELGRTLAEWYNNHKHKKVHESICGMVCLSCYIILVINVEEGVGLPFTITGVTGLFIALLTAILACEIFVRISNDDERQMITDEPNRNIPRAFSAVVPAAVIIAGFALFRMALVGMGVKQGLSEILYSFLSRPYRNATNSFGLASLFNVSTHSMWVFGIHGNNVLDEVAQKLFVAGDGPRLITKTLFDVFVYMGGSGTTLSLVLALVLFGKAKSYKMLFRYALPTSIFNINEPIIFGLPIVLNPIYAIPFVLTPVVMFGTTALAMQLGIVPFTTSEVSWATPVLLSGYFATSSIAGTLLQVFNLALGTMIYAPFVKLSERLMRYQFDRSYQDLLHVIDQDYSVTTRQIVSRNDDIGVTARHLAIDLQTAMRSQELFLLYQPIVDINENKLHSVEALLRWKHPQYGMINPMLVIAIAEEIGAIDELGLWIMEQAIIQRAEWTKEGMPDFHVSVNVSTMQLDKPDFHKKVLELLKRHDVPPHMIQVEITETLGLVENDTSRLNLANLSSMGVTIAMDDFGVGHSSLIYLRSQQITTLKIDGSLSREVAVNAANREIVATIIELCRLLEVGAIAEFVDNEQQCRVLREIGISLIQGYFFSPPIAGDRLIPFVQGELPTRLDLVAPNK